jgi:methoxymalonate biosynthesis acyl carrier protein
VIEETSAREQLRSFVHSYLGADLDDETNIFETGRLSSLFALELVTFVEATFGTTVENADLELANFESVDALTRFVERKQAVA